MIELKIEELLRKKLEEPEFEDCFLVDIEHNGNKKVAVFLDSDTGITFDTCRLISRYLEEYLDEEGWLGEKYILEVSSPGIDRPLRFKRQYRKNIGRVLKVQLTDGSQRKGTLLEVGDHHILLEAQKKKKKKTAEVVEVEIPFDQIESSVVQVLF